MKLPPRDYCEQLFEEHHVPINIKKHCYKVNQIAVFLARKLHDADEPLDIELVDRLSLLHDLFKAANIELKEDPRFDAPEPTPKELAYWKEIREKYPDMHETAIIASMLEHEYPAFASILRELDIYEKSALDKPIEVQIVHYADARVYSDKLVSTQERFDDAVKRYRFDKDEKTLTSWKKFTNGIRAIEKRIFSKISMNPDELGSQLS